MITPGQMQAPQVRKRLFLGLLVASLLVVGLLAGTVWYLLYHPTTLLHQVILIAVVGLVILAILAVGFGIGGIVLTIWLAQTIRPLQPLMRVAMSALFPFAIGLGRLFKIDTDKIKNSFIEVNNELVRTNQQALRPEQILLLAPHCLQESHCPHKVTHDINNCRRCGKCKVADLLMLRDKYGIRVGVATGGTLARKFVKEYRPRAIVAVACERDLASGIQDCSPIPVLGVLNDRPYGPCFNTSVNIAGVSRAVEFFLGCTTDRYEEGMKN
ncbi:DUF116 domain-containing protein [Desulforamulus hydrothermalis]|uniref:DUF116 domain-containing protein n=1 Tax=Desulforamulus hydrothermalis Lam5 = DSM 18033 TaxID=1121428 RepID=K8DXB1_9FIRM|nr:DUF116 domain-containing protein [Desulforamulus hydrothermalis]CCO07184.1 conserved membrane hypothetical protein [Desulforamulus hydrothermalis Lam5 = DSM 18033]SHG88297.1 hypothetical protein SAMN02745177_00687 [Desulforamulus hydrothermalis Lam5 = DSM 18033]